MTNELKVSDSRNVYAKFEGVGIMWLMAVGWKSQSKITNLTVEP